MIHKEAFPYVLFAGLVFETSAIVSVKFDTDTEVDELLVDLLQDVLIQRGVTYDVEGQGMSGFNYFFIYLLLLLLLI